MQKNISRAIFSVLLFALTVLGYQPQLFAQDSASEVSNFRTQLPELTHRGQIFSTGNLIFDTVTGPDAPVSTSEVTVVAWTWALNGGTPAGTIVTLCEVLSTGNSCIDVSQIPQGQTTAFQNSSPLNAFFVKFEVPGTGGIAIFLSTTNQVIVNYNV